MKSGYTHITMVLDRSGSMRSRRTDTEGGFEQFMEAQRRGEGQATVTLVQFDDQYQTDYAFRDVRFLPTLVYEPRGSTALLDALGKTIVLAGEALAAMKESDRPEHVIFVVMTDGYENASEEYTKAQVKLMVTEQEKTYNWQFVFLGANMDAIAEGGSIGTQYGSTMTYSTHNTQAAYGVTAQQVNSVRAGTRSKVEFTKADRDAVVAEDEPDTTDQTTPRPSGRVRKSK